MRRVLYSLLLLVACGGEPEPQPAFSVVLTADPETGAAPLVVNFSASVPGGGNEVGYTWSFGDGVTAQGSSSRAYTYTTPGTYPVTVSATSSGWSAEATATVTVTPPVVPPPPENAPPSVSLTASRTTGRAPVAVTFTATATDPDGDPLTYSFNFGDGTTRSAGEAAQAHRYAEPGRYAATVTVADGRGGVARAEVMMSVLDPEPEVPPTEPPPTPPVPENEAPTVDLNANAATGTAPLTVSFSAEADDPEGDDLSYVWDFGNGETAKGNSSRTLTYTEPGAYTAAVTVSDGLAETSADVLVTVEAPPAPPTAPPGNAAPSVSVSADPADGAVPLDVLLSAEADDPDGDALAYLWDFGDGTISGENPASHLYREAGTYTASVTVSDRKGGKARAEVTVTAVGDGSGGSDVPFYGQWAWAATGASQGALSGYLNVSEASTADDAGVDEFFVEGGKGAWASCADGADCTPDGVGRIDVLDFGGSRTFDIVFVDGATGENRLVAFDDDDRLTNEDGAPTFRGGGAWFYDDGSSDDLSFVMVKVANEPAAALGAALAKASR